MKKLGQVDAQMMNATGKPAIIHLCLSGIKNAITDQVTYIDYPLQSQQKLTAPKVSGGDCNPKNLIWQNGCI